MIGSNRATWLRGSVGLVAAAGCGMLDARSAGAQSAALQIGVAAREPMAQAYYAQSMGFFAKHGLAPQLHAASSGAATAAAVVGGDLQIGISNSLQLAQAHQHGVPLVILAPAGIHDARFPTTLCVVAADAAIASPKDLSGKIVAGASIGGLDQLAVSVLVDKSGGDAATVKFVEVPPGAMADALAQGRIAAAHLSEPDLSAAGSRVRSIGNAEDAIAPVFVQTAWFTTADWLAANKDVARRFAAAVFEAGTWAMNNGPAAAGILLSATGFKESVARQRFATTYDPTALQVVMDTASRYKMIAPVKAADFAWNGQ